MNVVDFIFDHFQNYDFPIGYVMATHFILDYQGKETAQKVDVFKDASVFVVTSIKRCACYV